MSEVSESEAGADVRRITTPPGGIMTDEVGAITGAVEVWLEGDHVRVRYEGALDVYTVCGEPGGRSLDELKGALTADPGPDEYGNPGAVSLSAG